MLKRGRIDQLPRVAAEFRRLDNARQEITIATATSAASLTPDEIGALQTRLETMTGGRVDLDVQMEAPSLLGGLVGASRRPLDRRERPRSPGSACGTGWSRVPSGDPAWQSVLTCR